MSALNSFFWSVDLVVLFVVVLGGIELDLLLFEISSFAEEEGMLFVIIVLALVA